MFKSRKQLEAYLAYQIHGRKLPQSERIGPRPGPPRRTQAIRDEDYKAWIRTLPSVVSGKQPCEACHVGTDGGASMKASDTTCIPLTPEEHREYHRIGCQSFARKYRLNYARTVARLQRAWRARAA